MNWKPTGVLLAAVAVVLAFIVFVEHPMRLQRERQSDHRLLPGLQPSAVTNIIIQPLGQPVIEARRESSNAPWRLIRPIAYRAQDDLISRFLGALSAVEWQNRLTEGELHDRPKAQDEFGFTTPAFTMLLQSCASDQRLEIGSLSTWHDQIAIQVVGDTAVYLADSSLLKSIPWDKNQWRDPALLDLSNTTITAIQIRSPGKDLSAGNELRLELDSTNHLWFVTIPLQARADTERIETLVEQLKAARVRYYVSDNPQDDLEPYGLLPAAQTSGLSLTFLNGTNKVAALQVGRSLTNEPGAVFARRDAPGNIVAVATNVLRGWQAPYTDFLDHHLLSLSPGLIESIAVQGEDSFVAQKQTNGEWQVVGKKTFPADAGFVADWLAGFTNVPTEIVKTVVTDFSHYGLAHPALQFTVNFAPRAKAPPAQIEFGIDTNGNVFERRLGEDFVNGVSRGDFERLPRASWQLRSRDIWNFDTSNLVSVTIHQRGGALKYLRDPDGEWTYAPGFANQVSVNSPLVEECLRRMGRLRAVYWDGIGDSDLERFGFDRVNHDVELEIRRDGKTETLRIQFGGRSPFTYPYASVVKNGERMIFEFPADLYENFVTHCLTVLTARRY